MGLHFILVFDVVTGILAELNEFIFMVCSEYNKSSAQSICKVLILTVVCGIGPTVAYNKCRILCGAW